ncbi:hypothetical protein pb186bvf_012380 [Paramecium bursaria]
MKKNLDHRNKNLKLDPIVRSNQARKTNQRELNSPATAKKQTNLFNTGGLVVLTNAFDFLFLATKTSDLEIIDQDGRNQLHLSALSQDHGNIREILTQFHNQKSKQIRADYISRLPKVEEQNEEIDNQEDIYNDLDQQVKYSSYKNKKRVQLDQDTEKQISDEIKNVFKAYINKIDNYGYSAIQICCFKNDLINQDVDQQGSMDQKSEQNRHNGKKVEKSEQESQKEINYKRFLCLQVLIEFGAEINRVNKHTLWAPLHWCAYYADIKSCELLISKGAYQFEHDREGMYPVDLAGIQDNVDNYNILEFLCKKLYTSLMNYKLFLDNNNKELQLVMEKQEEIIVYQEIYKAKGENLGSVLLYTKLLYWLCYICRNTETQDMITKLLQQVPNIFVQVPLFTLGNNTCLHSIINNRYLDMKDQESQNQESQIEYKKISEIRTQVLELLIKHSNFKNIFANDNEIIKDQQYDQAIQKQIVIDFQYFIDLGPIQLIPTIRYKNNYLREVNNYNKFIRRYNKNVQKFLNDRQYWMFLTDDQSTKDQFNKKKKLDKINYIKEEMEKQSQVRSSKKELSIKIKSSMKNPMEEQFQEQEIQIPVNQEKKHKHKHHHHQDQHKDQEEKKEILKNDSQISSAKPDKINLKLIVDESEVKQQKMVQFDEQQKSSSKIHPFKNQTFTRGLTKKKFQIQEPPQEVIKSDQKIQSNEEIKPKKKAVRELLEIIEKYCSRNIGILVGLEKKRLQFLFSDDVGMIDILLNCCANMEEENKEFFKAKQLSQKRKHYRTLSQLYKYS